MKKIIIDLNTWFQDAIEWVLEKPKQAEDPDDTDELIEQTTKRKVYFRVESGDAKKRFN